MEARVARTSNNWSYQVHSQEQREDEYMLSAPLAFSTLSSLGPQTREYCAHIHAGLSHIN